jgi:hypothetical protein
VIRIRIEASVLLCGKLRISETLTSLKEKPMTRHRFLAVSTGLALIGSLIPSRALGANHSEDQNPIRLYATATAGPIGVSHSLGGLSINGRTTHGEQLIWGGDLLRASNTNIVIDLSPLGRVTLRSGAIAKLSRARGTIENISEEILIAAIVTGEIDVRLSEAAAYVEARGSAFTALRGASFSVEAREGRALLNTTTGTVTEAQVAQPQYRIRPPVGQGGDISVKARATRQIQMQVTDENGRPMPDVPVVFALGGGGGSLSSGAAAGSTVTVTTNAQGIATASFTAGPTTGSASVTATVAGTSVSATVGVTTAAAGVLAGTTGIIAGVAAAAGAAATVVAVKKANDNGSVEPIAAQAPNITPKP